MREFLREQLKASGFGEIPTDFAYVDSLYECSGPTAAVLNIVGPGDDFAITRDELSSLNEELSGLFRDRGYQRVIIRNLLFTEDPAVTETEWGAGDTDWMWSLNEQEMYISRVPGPESRELYSRVKGLLYSAAAAKREASAMSGRAASTDFNDDYYGGYGSAAWYEEEQPEEKKPGSALKKLWDRLPVLTIVLIVVNIIVFLCLSAVGSTLDAGFMAEHGGLYAPYVLDEHRWYLLLTSMFLHFGFTHLSNNMLVFAIVGTYLERVVGKISFLLIYLLSGIGGNIFALAQCFATGSNVVTAGASGAVFGVIGAFVLLMALDRKAAGKLGGIRIGILVFISLYYVISSAGVGNISHVGGLLIGSVVCLVCYFVHRRREAAASSQNRLLSA